MLLSLMHIMAANSWTKYKNYRMIIYVSDL
jgi:hypothetical protein